MTEAIRTALKSILDVSNEFQTAVDELFNQGQAEFQTFFDKFSDLKNLYDSYVASNVPIEQKLSNLLENFLPALRQKLKRLQVKQTINANMGAELAVINLLIETPEIFHAIEQSERAIIEDFLSLETQGISVQYFFAEDVIGTPNSEEVALPGINYSPNGMSLPQNTEAPNTLISGVWRWLLEVPDNGFYNFYIEADAGAEISLLLNGQTVEMEILNGVWQNREAIELKIGQLYSMELIVKKVKNQLVFKWESQGIAKESIPIKYLYPHVFIGRFKNAYLRLLKILTIIEELQLGALELQYFGTHSNYQINSESWLNALPVSPSSTTDTTTLLAVFRNLLQYVELRSNLKVKDNTLAEIFNNPNATTEEGQSLLTQVTGWDNESLNIFYEYFGLSITDFTQIQPFVRIKEAFDLLKKLGIQATTLLESTTNEPTTETVRILQSGLRTRYDEKAWFKVIQPINNELRNHQRDALVAFVLHQLQKSEATQHIDTPDKLFEYFLIDVEMDACMKTSRIKQAISTVQLFIQRCLLNLEPNVASTSINAKQWEWMKRYRVWEANRKVFLFPENWLEPELRDNKSPFFKDLESELLQSDITEETAAIALVHYLEKLDEVAKLEICGMYYEENEINNVTDDIIHVIGRTSGANRKYYYRRLEGISWTPWEKIDVNIEDNPVLPVVWKGRLFLFWLSVLQEGPTDQKAPTTKSNSEITELKASDLKGDVKVTVKLALYWSEYYNNKWQSPKTSDVNRPVYLSLFDPNEFNRLNLEMASSLGNSGELNINISYENRFNVYFRLYNTHSLPIGVRVREYPRRLPSRTGVGLIQTQFFFLQLRSRIFRQDNNIFTIDYFDLLESDADERSFSQEILRNAVRYEVIEPKHSVQDIFETPFFFQDSRHVFYVQPVESQITLFNFSDFGIATFPSVIIEAVIPPIVVKPEVINPIPKTIFFPPERVRPGLVNPRPVEAFLDENIRVNQAVQSGGTIAYGDKLIGPGGSLERLEFDSLNTQI
ncbi:MAG: neuraminidase-like domain-containing protein [Lyngbya sp.]|nr:neuraminidase-like domain-containing protein [Lyngbya sp.]